MVDHSLAPSSSLITHSLTPSSLHLLVLLRVCSFTGSPTRSRPPSRAPPRRSRAVSLVPLRSAMKHAALFVALLLALAAAVAGDGSCSNFDYDSIDGRFAGSGPVRASPVEDGSSRVRGSSSTASTRAAARADRGGAGGA